MDLKNADLIIEKYLKNPSDYVYMEEFLGMSVIKFKFPKEIEFYVKQRQAEWREEWNKNIYNGELFPYVTHPEILYLTRKITELFLKEVLKKLDISEFEEWASGKAYDVGQRVMIPDAYWLIGGFNAKLMADFLREKSKKKKNIIFRSLGTGAGVYERSIYENFSDFSTITTDISIHSCVISALNLELYNVLQSSEKKLNVYLVKGRITNELLKKPRCVVIQVADCIEALKWDKENREIKYDAIGLDNFLPYFPINYVRETLTHCVDLLEKGGRIQFLGLDKTRVVVGELYKIIQILRGNNAKRFAKKIEIERKKLKNENKDFLFGYEVVYKQNGVGIIKEVIGVWAGNIFDWVRNLIFKFEIKDALIMNKAIKSATGLSALSDLVRTLTSEHFVAIKEILEKKGKKYNIIVDPGSEEKDGKKILRAATIDIE